MFDVMKLQTKKSLGAYTFFYLLHLPHKQLHSIFLILGEYGFEALNIYRFFQENIF